MKKLRDYLAHLSIGRTVLWCYLIWYLVIFVRYFDGDPRLWLTSLGIAGIVGTALYISSTANGNQLERWQTIRLYLMPFFVSSFSALVKNRGFILIFSPHPGEIVSALALCSGFCAMVFLAKGRKRKTFS